VKDPLTPERNSSLAGKEKQKKQETSISKVTKGRSDLPSESGTISRRPNYDIPLPSIASDSFVETFKDVRLSEVIRKSNEDGIAGLRRSYQVDSKIDKQQLSEAVIGTRTIGEYTHEADDEDYSSDNFEKQTPVKTKLKSPHRGKARYKDELSYIEGLNTAGK